VILIQVTITDDQDNVTQEIMEACNNQHGWEITKIFDRLGIRIAKIVDPSHE
jgi:hypothetical protein